MITKIKNFLKQIDYKLNKFFGCKIYGCILDISTYDGTNKDSLHCKLCNSVGKDVVYKKSTLNTLLLSDYIRELENEVIQLRKEKETMFPKSNKTNIFDIN